MKHRILMDVFTPKKECSYYQNYRNDLILLLYYLTIAKW